VVSDSVQVSEGFFGKNLVDKASKVTTRHRNSFLAQHALEDGKRTAIAVQDAGDHRIV